MATAAASMGMAAATAGLLSHTDGLASPGGGAPAQAARAPGTIRIRCFDHALARQLQARVDALRLIPPVPLTVDVAVGVSEPAAEPGAIFRQPGIAIYPGAPGRGVRIDWQIAPATALLDPGGTIARVVLSPAALRRLDECARVFLTTVLVFLLRRAGWHHVHSATAVDPHGTAWLIVGDAHAGKSTTAALLASLGWAVGGDDISFLASAGPRVAVVAARAPIALRAGAQRRFTAAGTPLPARRKVGHWPEELGGRWVDRIEPDVIAFVSAGRARLTTATPLAPHAAAAELVRASAWVMLEPESAQEHLDLLGRLARQARSFRVRLAQDLFGRPARLAELVR